MFFILMNETNLFLNYRLRYTERKMPLGELIDVLKNNVEAASDQCDSLPSYTRSQDSTNRSNSLSESSGNQTVLSSAGIAGNPIVNFHIVIEEKLAIHARKRYEKQVMCFFSHFVRFEIYNSPSFIFFINYRF